MSMGERDGRSNTRAIVRNDHTLHPHYSAHTRYDPPGRNVFTGIYLMSCQCRQFKEGCSGIDERGDATVLIPLVRPSVTHIFHIRKQSKRGGHTL